MDDAVGGEDVKLDDVGGASAGCDGDGLGVPVHGDLLAAQALEGCAALGHVLGLKKRKQTYVVNIKLRVLDEKDLNQVGLICVSSLS